MQEHDADFCDFREVTAVVMTWNAGASKPTSLRHDEQDLNFFRELLQPQDPPDILVFGFQELVDLEDKKVTARKFDVFRFDFWNMVLISTQAASSRKTRRRTLLNRSI